MKSKMKPQTNEFVRAIGELAAAQQQLARQAEQQYSFEVNSILRDQCCEPQRIGVSGSNTSLKTALMQDLLTGKKHVTALLIDTEEITS